MSEAKKDAAMQQPTRITWEGCNVLLDINDGDRLVFARLTPASTLKIGNKNYSLRPLIGCPFGSSFHVENGKDGPFLSCIVSSAEGTNVEEKRDLEIKDDSRDNRAIVDNNTSQSLTAEDIDSMKSQGATGDQIIEALIANSATFVKKTAFSQEKYRIKKQKKYAPRVLLRRPYARSICETYFKKYPARIGFLRIDALSLLLSLGNVCAYSDVLVVDRVGGILTGSVAERLGGTGYVCNTYLGVTPYPTEIVRLFNFSSEICRRIVHSPLANLCLAENTKSLQSGFLINPCDIAKQLNEEVSSASSFLHSVSMEEGDISSENGGEEIAPVVAAASGKCCKSSKAGEKAPEDAVKMWKENGFSSLLIAAPDIDAWKIVKEVLPMLSFSGSFAIYHQYLQPLSECMHNLQLGKMAIGLQISEPWLREYQVLPSRTHPHMQMSTFGGYILSGTRICNNELKPKPK